MTPLTDLHELRPESPAHGGAGVARHEGRAVMVELALPGELVRASRRGRRGGVQFARAEEVLEASPHRVPPLCPHFGACGGCQWQHADYGLQLEVKITVVAEA